MPDISNANENDQNRPLRETVSEPEYETRSTQQILPEETPEDLNIEDITSKSQTVESLDEQPFLEESSSGGGSSKYRKIRVSSCWYLWSTRIIYGNILHHFSIHT